MTTIENSAFVFMMIYLIATVIISGYLACYEIFFRLRSHIDYKNYRFYERMYLQKPDAFRLTLIGGVYLLGLIVFGVYVADMVINIYLTALIPIFATMAIFIYLELTRSQYNNPFITNFDGYFQEISKTEKTQTRLLKNIKEIQSEFNISEKELYIDFKRLLDIVPDDRKDKEFQRFKMECDKEFSQAIEELENYNSSIISQFNESLSEYLNQGIMADYQIPDFTPIDVNTFATYKSELQDMYVEYFDAFFTTQLSNGNVKKAADFILAFEIANKYGLTLNPNQVFSVLLSLQSNCDEKVTVANYMMVNNLIPEAIILGGVLERDWDWAFDVKRIYSMPRKDLIHGFQLVVEKNAKKCCKKMLNYNYQDQILVIDKVLALVHDDTNACVRLLRFNRLIKDSTQEFSDPTTMYENMAIALKYYYKNSDNYENKAEINAICSTEEFYQNKEKISSLYNEASKKLKEIYQPMTDVLLCYFDGELSQNKLLDANLIMNFYLDNMLTLNDETLKVLNLLISAIVLIYDPDKKHIQSAVNSIMYSPFINDIQINFDQIQETGKKIIRKICKNYLVVLINIVNRTEKERLSLDILLKV